MGVQKCRMSMPYRGACPECASFLLSVQDRCYCANEGCDEYGEVVCGE
jgi:hypothetical protein